jgi:tRNA (mo5U34)-methyltransferase
MFGRSRRRTQSIEGLFLKQYRRAVGRDDAMTEARDRVEEAIRSCSEWYHSIELAPGVATPGRQPAEAWQRMLVQLRLPDLTDKSVLDIGAYDGFFSFAAERLGAARVTALDHYVWSADMAEYMKDWREARLTGAPIPPLHKSRHWRPEELPGRRPFDTARVILGSRVEPVVGDFMTMDLTELGQYDVVLFLGVLYHLEEPLRAMRRVAHVTAPGGLAVIESEAMAVPGREDTAFCEFFPSQELNNDPTNWWSPNAKALEGLCRAAGFREVTILTEPPYLPWRPRRERISAAIKQLVAATQIPKRLGYWEEPCPPVMRYRAIAHARL